MASVLIVTLLDDTEITLPKTESINGQEREASYESQYGVYTNDFSNPGAYTMVPWSQIKKVRVE